MGSVAAAIVSGFSYISYRNWQICYLQLSWWHPFHQLSLLDLEATFSSVIYTCLGGIFFVSYLHLSWWHLFHELSPLVFVASFSSVISTCLGGIFSINYLHLSRWYQFRQLLDRCFLCLSLRHPCLMNLLSGDLHCNAAAAVPGLPKSIAESEHPPVLTLTVASSSGQSNSRVIVASSRGHCNPRVDITSTRGQSNLTRPVYYIHPGLPNESHV